MAWTAATRVDYARHHSAYASDVTDREWSMMVVHLSPAKPGGRPRTTCLRRVVNAIFYLIQTGCQWRMLPRDFPPRSTVYGYFQRWRNDGTWACLHDALYRRCRDLEGREESPTAAIIDSQSVKTGPHARDTVGFDAGNKIKGRKRHLMTDMLGLMMRLEVHSAGTRDRPSRGYAAQTAAGQRMGRRFCSTGSRPVSPSSNGSLPMPDTKVRASQAQRQDPSRSSSVQTPASSSRPSVGSSSAPSHGSPSTGGWQTTSSASPKPFTR